MGEGRNQLWEEKLGLREKFTGNEATRWGTQREDEALDSYRKLTGHQVEMRSFKVLGNSLVTSWLGASPDGLVDAVLTPSGPFPVQVLGKLVYYCCGVS